MLTSTAEVGAAAVRFEGDVLHVALTDGREVAVPMARVPWLAWLLRATPEQRERWSVEPDGFAVYWDELDDGVEVAHLLSRRPLS
jgi:hypothetical protein